ncbi:hypothetical protein ABFA07_009352 [Porites harrisoni]
MPRAFLLKRDFDDGNYFSGEKILFIHQDGEKSTSKDFSDVRRSKRPGGPAKIKKEDAEEELLNAFQKKKKLSYPADVRIDGRVNDIGKILRFADDFINNEKKMSEKDAQKSSLSEISLIAGHRILQGNELFQNSGTGGFESSKKANSSSGDLKRVAPSTNRKFPPMNKANELNGTGAKNRSDKTVHKCNQCGKVFKTKYTLSIHLKMPDHTKSRPFVCNVCGKGFRLSSTLCRHKIIHTEKKPHKCDECGKSFNRSSTLKTHLRTHSDKKAFICDICGKGFHQKGNLRNHIMIHTGEKPFRCNQCNRAFNKMSNLKFHMHTHSDNLPFHCRTCRKRFSKKTDLKEHVEQAH